jgi:hypothetical protein
MNHRWISRSGPTGGSWAECRWCMASAYCQVRDGKPAILYQAGLFGDPDGPFREITNEPPCTGQEGVFYDHDFNFDEGIEGDYYICRNCGARLKYDLSDDEPNRCLEKKSC